MQLDERAVVSVLLIVALATAEASYLHAADVSEPPAREAEAELASPFLWARTSARARLAAGQDPEACVELLRRADHRVREAAMAGLAAWLVESREKTDEGTVAQEPAIGSDRTRAARAERTVDRGRLLDEALRALDREPDPATRQAMARSLAGLEDEALQHAIAFGPEVRSMVLDALVRAELEGLLETITSLRGSIKGFFRDPFEALLAYDRQVPEILLAIAADPALSESLRGLAVRALGETENRALVVALRPILDRQRRIVDERESLEAFPFGLDGQLYRALRYVLYRLGDTQPFFSRITDLKLRGLRALQTRRKQIYFFEYEWEVAYEWHQVKEYEMASKRYLDLIRQLEAYELTIPSITRISYYNLACIASIQGDLDTSFEYLEEAIALGFTDLDWILIDRDLEALRADERFADIHDRLETD